MVLAIDLTMCCNRHLRQYLPYHPGHHLSFSPHTFLIIMEVIRHWLNGSRDYATGVRLYDQHGSNKLLKRLFSEEAPNETKKQRLVKELEAMLKGQVKEVLQVTQLEQRIIQTTKQEAKPARTRWSEKMDEVEKSIFETWKPLYSEMLHLQTTIDALARAGVKDPDQEKQAGVMALRIIELDKLCDNLYEERDYYLQHGKRKESTGPVEISLLPEQWHKKLANHQRYIRDYRKQLEKDPTNTNAAAQIQKHEWAVAEYKKLLKIE
jgi:hypothetical protein